MDSGDELKDIWHRAQQEIEKTKARHAIPEPAWRRAVRSSFTVFFLLVWLNAALAAYIFISTYNRHTNQTRPTAVYTQPLSSHGRTVYITPQEKVRVTFFMWGFMIGIPTAFVLAIILEASGIGAFEPPAKRMSKQSAGVDS
jgi:hypothetical protein